MTPRSATSSTGRRPPAPDVLTIAANGLRFHALAAGPADGPLLLLLHGFAETSHGWTKQIAPLAEAGRRVVPPDQRGVGLSSKPAGVAQYRLDLLTEDVAAIVRALGRGRASLVGHDWGGVVAWHLLEHHRGVVERAAILDAPHPAIFPADMLRHPTPLGRSWCMAFFQLPWLPEALLVVAAFQWLPRAPTASNRPGAFSSVDLRVYRDGRARPGALTGLLNAYRALPLGSRRAPPRDPIAAPVRLLWGDRDSALEPGLAETSIARCRDDEVTHLPEATHWLQHEEPRRVNALLLEFLGRG